LSSGLGRGGWLVGARGRLRITSSPRSLVAPQRRLAGWPGPSVISAAIDTSARIGAALAGDHRLAAGGESRAGQR
jgi:hypothetical protein